MIKNEETYCIVYHKIVRELGAYEAIIYSTIVSLLRKSDGIGEVSNQTLMDMCGIGNKMSLFRYINKLIESGYIEKREGKGRGNISIYYVTEKGNNLLPINDKKGNKNDIKKVTKMNEKGNNLLPINKGINKEINKEGDMRDAQSLSPSPSFNEFLELFNPSPEFEYEIENARKDWNEKTDAEQKELIEQLRSGIRWSKKQNPHWFIKDFHIQQATVWSYEKFYEEFHTTCKTGYCIIRERDKSGHIQFMKTSEAKTAGVEIERECIEDF